MAVAAIHAIPAPVSVPRWFLTACNDERGATLGRMTFPRSLPAFMRRFGDDDACRAALAAWRWGVGFDCPACGNATAWVGAGGLRTCRACRRPVSLTAGTVLHDSHLPLSTWLAAAYIVASGRGTNSLTLASQLGVANKETALLVLRRFRLAMATSLVEPLAGEVEADETLVGGITPGAKGRTTKGTSKRMVLVLAERGSGRARMRVIPDATSPSLETLIVSLVAPGARVITDGHAGYQHLPDLGFTWDRRPHPPGGMTHDSPHATPTADGLIAAFKDWLRATYRKPPVDLDPYLAEFCFRREFRDPAVAVPLLLTAARP